MSNNVLSSPKIKQASTDNQARAGTRETGLLTNKLFIRPEIRRVLEPSRKLLRILETSLAPPRCAGCLQEMTWLCQDCWKTVQPMTLSCVQCGQPNLHGITCPPCRKETALAGLVTVSSYDVPIFQRSIRWLKFKGIRPLAPLLADLLLLRLLVIAPLKRLQDLAVIVPVPLHPRRQRERGFNQSYDIAASLAQKTQIPLIEAIKRPRATWIQRELPADLRQENMHGAFAAADNLPENRPIILLIDDVTTTGATFDAAATALKASGRQIWGCAIARG